MHVCGVGQIPHTREARVQFLVSHCKSLISAIVIPFKIFKVRFSSVNCTFLRLIVHCSVQIYRIDVAV